MNVKVRVTDAADVLVSEFTATCKAEADSRIDDTRAWALRFGKHPFPLHIVRSDECAVTMNPRTGETCGEPPVALVLGKPVCAAHRDSAADAAALIENVMRSGS